jgi:hypothetical protein
MLGTVVNIESVTLKSGVLFVHTSSGGTLIDISADRYIALTPLSAVIWSGLSESRAVHNLIGKIMQVKSVDAAQAEALLRRQLARWEEADLINPHGLPPVQLPQAKVSPQTQAGEVDADKIAQEPLLPLLLAKLFAIESKYRLALRQLGLARTLILLQTESGRPKSATEGIILRTLRNYHALRRLFRQGKTAHDCLLRSLGLAAALRRHGVQTDLCIGITDLPFAAHAWVEGHGLVLNETLSKREKYTVIGRF